MQSIPPTAYIIIGIVVSGFSVVVSRAANSGGMQIFTLIGIILLLIGAYKLFKGKAKPKEAKTHTIRTTRAQAGQCPRCRAINHPKYNFCYHCGQQLRKL